MKNVLRVLVGAGLLALVVGAVAYRLSQSAPTTPDVVPKESASAGILVQPLTDASARVTLKPFGIFVSPGHSPVSPERFTGYHTGVDFETTAGEQDTDVTVSAVCEGPVLEKRTATGYGGIVVQSCEVHGEPVTVVYGHLRLASVAVVLGQNLNAGDRIGVLGTGYTTETGGERKHLHLGIHRGADVNIRGYVRDAEELTAWLDSTSCLNGGAN